MLRSHSHRRAGRINQPDSRRVKCETIHDSVHQGLQSFLQAEGLLRCAADCSENREIALSQPEPSRALTFQGGLVQRLRSTVQPVRGHLRLHEVETLNR